jgi:uncharacterized membrane protein
MTSEAQALSGRGQGSFRLLATAAWLVVGLVAAGFIYKYVLHYYLNYTPAAFNGFWPRRAGLLMHISGGMVALAIGPFQFWTAFRAKVPALHRWTGRLFLLAVAVGSVGGLYLAMTTEGALPYAMGLGMLAVAWAGCAAVAYVAIRNRAIAVHRRWMIRTYVVTFAFVTFRLVTDWLPTAHYRPVQDLVAADAWGCWAIPLLITMLIQGLQDARRRGRWT